MRRRWLLITVAAIGLALVVGAAWAAPLRQESGGPVAAVETGDNFFGPETITVAAGTTITWTNTGLAPHTITADDQSWDSGRVDNGGTFSMTFSTPGTYGYYCAYHGGPGAGMFGSIVVTDGSAASDTSGQTTDVQTTTP